MIKRIKEQINVSPLLGDKLNGNKNKLPPYNCVSTNIFLVNFSSSDYELLGKRTKI